MGKKEELSNNPEFQALMENQDIDASKLMEQSGIKPPAEPGTPPAEPGTPPAEPGTPPTESGTPPAESGTPPAESGTPPAEPGTPNPKDILLKEIFGDRFKTVEEAKEANITSVLDEVATLRTEKADLETQLSSKPKTNFANDEVALYNEFVKNTGVQNFGVFKKINSAQLADMKPMEAMVTKYVLDHPEMSGKETQVQKYFEKKYNVDPDQVDEEELAINQVGLEADGSSARKSLQEVKDKLVVPDPVPGDPQKPKELSPEEKTTLQTGWNNVGANISTSLAKLKVPIKNSKDPLLDYEVSESEQKEITKFVTNYAVENRMELNEDNVRTLSTMVYNQLMLNKLPEIVHSVFEKARSMTEEQVHAIYENPSPNRNNDTPPVPPEPKQTTEEEIQDKIFNAEMEQYDK